MLCQAPEELKDERTAYFKAQTDNQMKSVDNNLMRENDPRMPLFNERKTKVTLVKAINFNRRLFSWLIQLLMPLMGCTRWFDWWSSLHRCYSTNEDS